MFNYTSQKERFSVINRYFIKLACVLLCLHVYPLHAMHNFKRTSSSAGIEDITAKRQMQREKNMRKIAFRKAQLSKLLFISCNRNDYYMSRIFLRKGANPNYQQGTSTCFSVTLDPSIQLLLIQYGANPNIYFHSLQRPIPLQGVLHRRWAAENSHSGIDSPYSVDSFKALFNELLAAGADPVCAESRAKEEHGYTSLISDAFCFNLHDEFFALLEHGASPYITRYLFFLGETLSSIYKTRGKLVHRLIRASVEDYAEWKGEEFYSQFYAEKPLTKLLLRHYNHKILGADKEELKQQFLQQLERYQQSFFTLSGDEQAKIAEELEECAVIMSTRYGVKKNAVIPVIITCGLDVRKIIIEVMTNLVHAGCAQEIAHYISQLAQSRETRGETTYGVSMDGCSNDEYEKFMVFAALNNQRAVFIQLLHAGAPFSRARHVVGKLILHCETEKVQTFFTKILRADEIDNVLESESKNSLSYLSLLPRDMVRFFLKKFVAAAVF